MLEELSFGLSVTVLSFTFLFIGVYIGTFTAAAAVGCPSLRHMSKTKADTTTMKILRLLIVFDLISQNSKN